MSVKFKKLTYNFVYFDTSKIEYILKSKYLVYNIIHLHYVHYCFSLNRLGNINKDIKLNVKINYVVIIITI